MFYKKQFYVNLATYNPFGFMVVVTPLYDGEAVLGETVFYKEGNNMNPLNLLYLEVQRKKVLWLATGYTCSLFFEAPANNSVILEVGSYLYAKYAKMNDAEIKEVFENKISSLHDLAQSRPLLIREQIELSFLEKIQAADNLAALQSLENELNNTPTDPELIKRLLKYTADKKAFY